MEAWLLGALGGAAATVGAGAVYVVVRRRRASRERQREARETQQRDQLRAAFTDATVTVHDVERLGLKDAETVEPVIPGLPYVLEVTLTVRPAADVAWTPQELGVVEDESAGTGEIGATLRLVRAVALRSDDSSAPTVGAERVKLSVRSRTAGPTFRLEYGGAVFGTVVAHGATVRATRPIPASLRAPAVALMVGPPPEPGAAAVPLPWATAAAPMPTGTVRSAPTPVEIPAALRSPTPPPATAILGGSLVAPRRPPPRSPAPPPPVAPPPALHAVTPPPWQGFDTPVVVHVRFEVLGTSS